MFAGLFTALITPFDDDLRLDLESFTNLLQVQNTSGVDGVVIAGSTGESASISNDELGTLISSAQSYRSKDFKVIASIGSNNTQASLTKLQAAQSAGVDGVLVVNPYYNRPTEDGIIGHFKAISDASNCPIIVYNVPKRTGFNISDELIAKLFELPNICCLKDASGDLSRPANILDLVGEKADANVSITQLSGDDATMVAFNAMGGAGLISVISNIIPEVLVRIQSLTRANNFAGAAKLYFRYHKLIKSMGVETNPGPVKYAAFRQGLIKNPGLRLPLAGLRPESRVIVEDAMRKCVHNSKIAS